MAILSVPSLDCQRFAVLRRIGAQEVRRCEALDDFGSMNSARRDA
jgi:hypothetical protein